MSCEPTLNYADTFLDEDAHRTDDSSDSKDDWNPEMDTDPVLDPRPIQVEATQSLHEQLDGPLLENVMNVLQFMDEQGLNITIFLDALSWGDPDCNSPKIRYARTGLLLSEELPSIL